MDPSLQLYKRTIDGLAQLHKGVHRRWIREGWPDSPKNKGINDLLSRLDAREKELLADLLEHAHDGGIHCALGYLNDQMAIDGMRIVQDGVEMAHQPFGAELYYDWKSRRLGNAWPDEDEPDEELEGGAGTSA